MSDTPRTDAIAHRGYHLDALAARAIDLCRELERENAALLKDRQALLAAYGAATPDGCDLPPSGIYSLPDKVRAIIADNAALRADKERLDWLEKARPIAWALGNSTCGEYWLLTDLGEGHPEEAEEFPTLREAIDAARKEAQP